MISDPITTPALPEESAAGSFTLRDFSGTKTLRHGSNTTSALAGLKDLITISHSEDPKTGRQRSLFRVDYEHNVIVNEVATGETEVITMYVVADFKPATSLSFVNAALTRLSTLWNNAAISTTVATTTSVLYKWLRREP